MEDSHPTAPEALALEDPGEQEESEEEEFEEEKSKMKSTYRSSFSKIQTGRPAVKRLSRWEKWGTNDALSLLSAVCEMETGKSGRQRSMP